MIPIYASFPIEAHGGYVYPSWLWPGSVVDALYDLSVQLAETFDWPLASANVPGSIRPRSRVRRMVRPYWRSSESASDRARWESKHSSIGLNPQWRMRLTLPPWLPEEEVLRAFRALRRQRARGRQLPKMEKTLEVARFVWERERLDGYRDPPPWTQWVEQWNAEHPGHPFETANHFRMSFIRRNAAVKHLNFDPPNPW